MEQLRTDAKPCNELHPIQGLFVLGEQLVHVGIEPALRFLVGAALRADARLITREFDTELQRTALSSTIFSASGIRCCVNSEPSASFSLSFCPLANLLPRHANQRELPAVETHLKVAS